MQQATITFIGAGNMASSLIGGLINAGYSVENIWATDAAPDKLRHLQTSLGIHTTDNNEEGAKQADIIVLAVKPNVLKAVVNELRPVISERQPLLISIAAGIRETTIRNWLGLDVSIVRCMPNTPALVGYGATGLYANSLVSADQKDSAESILRSVGITQWIDSEDDMDIVTALSGSGPAYFFLVMEALLQAAIELGLPEQTAKLLTTQTALGSARIVLESGQDVAKLRQNVTSPGGTTEAALNVLAEGKLKALFAKAVNAAKKRSRELAEMID